jgi:hypothetical protein
MVQIAEYLPNKHKALKSSPNTSKGGKIQTRLRFLHIFKIFFKKFLISFLNDLTLMIPGILL